MKQYSPLKIMYTPQSNEDAVNKKFVENLLSKKIKDNCLVATSGNLTNFTYDTVTQQLKQDVDYEDELVISNVSLPLNTRILVLNQTSQTENGIYYVEQVGVKKIDETYVKSDVGNLTVVADGTLTNATTEVELSTVQLLNNALNVGDTVTHISAMAGVPCILKRTEDFNDSSDIATGTIVNITTTNEQYMLITKEPIIIDTTNILFAKSSADDNGAKSYETKITIADNVYEYEINHNLNNKNIIVSIKDETFETCFIDYNILNENKITIVFDITALPVSNSEFYVVILAK